MDSWRWIAFPLLLLACAGCKAGKLTEPLERENRHLEDVIYELKDHVCELEAQLNSAQLENEALRNQVGGEPGTTIPRTNRSPSGNGVAPPELEMGEPTETLPGNPFRTEPLDSAPPYQGPPLISPPSPDRPEGILPDAEEFPTPDAPAEPTPAIAPTSAEMEVLDDAPVAVAAADDQVAKITLNRQLTGGHDRDGRPGDDGLMIVVEPRNAAGKIIRAAGKLSIVALDPALEGPDARVARWDLSPQQAAGLFKKTLLGEGIHIALPWPHSPPRHSELSLFVRLTRADDEELVVERPIRVKLIARPPLHSADVPMAFPESEVRRAAHWQARGQVVPPVVAPASGRSRPGAAATPPPMGNSSWRR